MNNSQAIIQDFLTENTEYTSISWENGKVLATFIFKPNKTYSVDDFVEGSATYRLLFKLTQRLAEK